MRQAFILLICFLIVLMATQNVNALSCRGGRASCMASCMAQNCATGYCPSGPEGVCICSRCNNGPSPIWQNR
jgi:hypothetical protein